MSTTRSYSGDLSSLAYSKNLVKGKVYATISLDNTTGLIMLVYEGKYRKGDSVVIPVKINARKVGTRQYIYTFKGKIQQQIITFEAEEFTDEVIQGTYSTFNPVDHGTFRLKCDNDNVSFVNKTNESCMIL